MNTAVWVCQIFLAVLFAGSGLTKATRSEAWLIAHGQTGVAGFPAWFRRFIGIAEILGAIGVILPWLIGVAPILTPIAAAALGLIMPPAAIIHLRKRELPSIIVNVVVIAIVVFVVYERGMALGLWA